MKICVNLLTHWDSVGAQKQQNRCRSIVRVLKCLCRGGVVFASCWSSVHVRLDFPLKAMQIYAFSVESPNKIGYFFDLSHPFFVLSYFNIFSRAEYSASYTSCMKLSGNPSQTGFTLHSMLVRMAFNSASDSSQMLNTSGAVLVIFILRNLNS